MTVKLQESFSKLILPFIFARNGEAPPALERLRSEILHVPAFPKRGDEPDPSRPAKLRQWTPIPSKMLGRMTERLTEPLPYYFLGDEPVQEFASKHVLALRWSEELSGYFAELRVGFERARSAVLDLVGVELYLFSSGAGVLSIEIKPRELRVRREENEGAAIYEPFTASDLVEINYRLRTLNARRPATLLSLRWKRALEKSTEGGATPAGGRPTHVETAPALGEGSLHERLCAAREFTVLDIIEHCRDSLQNLVDIKIRRERGLHILTFARTERGATFQQCADDFFRLRRVYDRNYKGPPWALNPETDRDEILQSFEQVYLGVSAEGCAVLVLDDGTEFFNQLADRVRHGYFAMFLIAIHERVMLEELAYQSCRLPEVHDAARQARAARSELIEKVRNARKSVFEFTLHHSQYVVSHVHMYQEIYERMIDAMRVPVMHQHVESEIANMQQILEEHHEEKSTRSRDLLASLVGVLGIVSLLLAFWGANWKEVQGRSMGDAWVMASALAAIVLAFLLFAARRRT